MNMMTIMVRSGWALRGLLLLLLSLMTIATEAVPAMPGIKRQISLSDGTTVVVQLVGDEHAHCWVAADGRAFQERQLGVFESVDVNALKLQADQRRQEFNEGFSHRLGLNRVGEVGSYFGQKRGLIILVNFADVAFTMEDADGLFERIANEENFSYGRFKGSVRDYFYAQSEGQFELTFDVVGPVNVSNNAVYYGGNKSNGGDSHPASMVIEACQQANSQVNFADYDWDGNGYVDQVYVVYAGKGEADGGPADTIWPHTWKLSYAKSRGDGTGALKLDGVTIDTYACGPELNGLNLVSGIGTICHEFSHCLGYPDFYDTDFSGGQGMWNWDLLDHGNYNDRGYQPAGYTSYERWLAGWKTPVELLNSQRVKNMKPLQDGGEAYIIYNKGNKNEYFLLENRYQTGWDTSLSGGGLLIVHVDYNATAWKNNKPNDDPNHQRMTWIPADNEYQLNPNTKKYYDYGLAQDPFPFGDVNAFGPTTTPAAKLYNKNTNGTYFLDSSVEEITLNDDGTISFVFRGIGELPREILLGDANDDGLVNVADVMAIVNHILGNEVQTFVFENADLNADQAINVSDVMRVVNIILNLNPEAGE